MPTQSNKEAKLNSEIHSQLEPGSGRTRRSAALHSKQAWQSLVPHHKKDDEETDEDIERLQSVERSTKRKSTAVIKDNGSKKRLRESRIDDPDFDGDEISNNLNVEENEVNTVGNANNNETKPNNLLQKQKPTTENEKNSVQSSTPHQRVSILGKRLPILAPKTNSFSSGVTVNQSNNTPARLPPQQLLLKSGAGALNKEELEEIEREMEKHQFQNDDSYKDDYDELEQKIKLDHSNDEDYEDLPSRASKRLGAIRTKTLYKKREVGQTPAPVGRPRGPSKNIKKGTKPVEGNTESPMTKTNIPSKIRKGEYDKKPVIIKPSGMPFYSNVYQPNQIARNPISGQFPNDNRTLKVLRIRTGAPNSVCQPPLSNMPNQSRQIIPSVSYTSMINGLSKEINDLAEKYSNCIVPGSTVQEFNNIIDQIIQELKRVTEEKALIVAENREFVDNINAQLELKDRKIVQLENTIETLQSKLMVAFKRIQMNALKHETITAGNADDSKMNVHSLSASSSQKMTSEDSVQNDKNEIKKKGFYEKELNSQNNSTSQGGGVTIGENVATSSESTGNIVIRPPPQLQKVLQSPRMLNEDGHHYVSNRETIPKVQLTRRSEVKHYKNEEDENEMDEEEHYEKGSSSIIKYSNIKSSTSGGRKPVMLSASATGGGSIFSSTRVMMPTSLNTLQGKFVPNNSRTFCNESEEGYEDEEEIMDEEMAIADEDLVHSGEVGANQTVL